MAKGKKTGGRDKGTPNVITKEIREILHELIETELQTIDEKLGTLTTKERLEVVIKLLPYVMPKMEQNEITINHSQELPPIIIQVEEDK